MTDDDMITFAGVVAEAVLRRLGDNAPPWQVLAVKWRQEVMPAPAGLSMPNNLLLTIGPADRDADVGTVWVYFSADVPREHAVAVMAGQIQDHAIEETHGRALPPCPGHQHPLTNRWVNGVASWVCPRGADHYWEPILPSQNT